MKRWCALLAAMMVMITAAWAERLSGGEDFWGEVYTCTIENGYLIYRSADGKSYQPIAVKDGFVEAARGILEEKAYSAAPMGLAEELLPYVADELTGSETLVEIYCTPQIVVPHTRDAVQGDALRVARWFPDEQKYSVYVKRIGTSFWLDTYHAGGYMILVGVEDWRFCCVYLQGTVKLTEVWTSDGEIDIEPHAIHIMEDTTPGGNDGYFYGNHPFYDLETLDLANFPKTFEEMMDMVDNSEWAVVNNPNPTDRLWLRAEPSKSGRALGKFYNRTPVKVDEIRGEWAHVTIGRYTTGWMMKKYLEFGDQMDKVACAFPQMAVKEAAYVSYEDETIYEYEVWSEASKTAVQWLWDSSMTLYFIGVKDNYYIVMNEQEQVGYIPQENLWEGNG